MLFVTQFFIVGWIPAILAREGLSELTAARGGIMVTLGGMGGTFLVGLLGVRFELIKVCMIYLGGAFVLAILFGFSTGAMLLPVCAILGFLLIGAVVGLYALAARIFPAAVRSSGTGLAIAFGRIGAVVGLSLGGLLIGKGWSRPAYVAVLSLPLLAAIVSTRALRPFSAK
jgi:MFS family permease